jgi:predicted nucleic acid-binding Zn ribbon protein
MSDADPTICPACGLETVSKQVTAPSFRLAGSGWYETDFKKEGDKKKNLADNKVSADKPITDKPVTPASTPKAE